MAEARDKVKDDPTYDEIRWESAAKLVERLTAQITREFKTSRPKPRNRVMGFAGEGMGMIIGKSPRMNYGW